MKFNSNKERRFYWESLNISYSNEEMDKALATLKSDTSKVLQLHYLHKYSLKEIAKLLNRSIAVIRNHHNRGIYKLYRHFNPRSSDIV